jgi:hypothetical protein
MACDIQDPDETYAVVEASGLKMHNNVLMISYDDLGHRYEIPPFIINEPVSYGEEMPLAAVAKENG